MKMRTAVVRMQCVRLWMGTGYLLSVQVIYVPTHLRSRHSFAVACGACLLSHLLSIAHSRRRVHGNYGGMHQLPETLHRLVSFPVCLIASCLHLSLLLSAGPKCSSIPQARRGGPPAQPHVPAVLVAVWPEHMLTVHDNALTTSMFLHTGKCITYH